MNICLECHQETANPKFCNSSCAAKFNNKNRIDRCPNRFNIKSGICVNCKSNCDVNIRTSKEKIYCNHCKQLRNLCKCCGECNCKNKRCQKYRFDTIQRIFKIDLSDVMGTSRIFSKLEIIRELLYDLYHKQKLSTEEIARLYSTSSEYIRNQLKWFDIGRRIDVGTSKYYHQGYHITWEGREIYYRSSYELKYAMELDDAKISYDVESLVFYHDVTDKRKKYVPDFYLLDMNLIVEIKSTWTYDFEEMSKRFEIYRNSGYKTLLILDGVHYQDLPSI